MASREPHPTSDDPVGPDPRWGRVTNAIAAVVVGFVLFALGVVDRLGLLEVLAALVIFGGGITLMIALVRISGGR